jgi:predicted nucleic acid-binding protein
MDVSINAKRLRATLPSVVKRVQKGTRFKTLVTTDFVVDETLTLIRVRLGLEAAEHWWQQVDGSPRLRWGRIDADRFEKARHLFFRYPDKDYSFTACTSFVVMRELRLTRALTTDAHFGQMGLQALPTVPPVRRARRSRAR